LKILLIGSFGPGALEHYYVKGLRTLGAICQTIDITSNYYNQIGKTFIHKTINRINPNLFYNSINQDLLRKLEGKMFDVILVVKGMTLYSKTIIELKQFTRLLCCYNPDHPFLYYSSGSGNKNILESIVHYDVYISYAKKIVNELKSKFGIDSFVLPFGYDEDVKTDSSKYNNLETRFVFIGTYDSERKSLLDKLKTKNVLIYGDQKWRSRTLPFSRSRKYYTGKALFNQDYADAVAAAGGVFNFLRKQNLVEDSHNMRTFEVPGYGGLLISNRTEEQLQYFDEDKEAIYFDSIDELNDKIKFLEKNPFLISRIKQNSWDRCQRSSYGYRSRSLTLLAKLNEYLT